MKDEGYFNEKTFSSMEEAKKHKNNIHLLWKTKDFLTITSFLPWKTLKKKQKRVALDLGSRHDLTVGEAEPPQGAPPQGGRQRCGARWPSSLSPSLSALSLLTGTRACVHSLSVSQNE